MVPLRHINSDEKVRKAQLDLVVVDLYWIYFAGRKKIPRVESKTGFASVFVDKTDGRTFS